MRKSPSAIIIARHGIRLDASNKDWQANAERPYDTPLSYGGWIQCQTLGARISKELQTLDNQTTQDDLLNEEQGIDIPRPRKRRKIMIHTSPYLRCVQTSIAIAAGLRYPQLDRFRHLTSTAQRSVSKSSLAFDGQGPTSAPTSTLNNGPKSKETQPDKMPLRIDPYLGEWLSPTYFEQGMSPPSSKEMVDTAKKALKVPAEDIKGADIAPPSPIDESDDGVNASNPSGTVEKSGLRAMAAAGHSLPHRTRTTSFAREPITNSGRPTVDTRRRSRASSYTPPVPMYSLAPQDPIPIGYVAHARDACVEPEFGWDSEAMNWGHGGEYGEEWSTMHRRFRNGLQKMLNYYETEYEITGDEELEDEDDTDLVLILVTHQAGANALIRLLTGAPALHDIGTASLTLAVRRPVLRRQPSLEYTNFSPVSRRISRRGSLDIGLADDYEMRIIASTEHLRGGSNPLGLNSPRLGKSPAFAGRRLVGADSPDGFSIGDPLAWRSSSATGLGRTSSQRSHAADGVTRVRGNSGLWGSPASTPIDENEVMDDIPMSPRSRPTTPGPKEPSEEDIPSIQPLGRSNTLGNTGLWGGGGGGGVGSVQRRHGSGSALSRDPPRRSWTVDQSS